MGSILILYNLFTWLEMQTKSTTIYIVTSRVTEVVYSWASDVFGKQDDRLLGN